MIRPVDRAEKVDIPRGDDSITEEIDLVRKRTAHVIKLGLGAMLAASAYGGTIYNNLTPNTSMGIATRPEAGAAFEIEAGDDFFLGSPTRIESASFVGILVGGTASDISNVVAEMYRVFPKDSDTIRTPNVPSRTNSPSDVAFDTRDSGSGLTFTTTVLSNAFTVDNSVQPGGIHQQPGQTTGGNGSLTGQEVRIDLTFTNPFNLPQDHFFFVPQVLSSGGQFYWVSASRPISGAGTTPFPAGVTDLQAWTRDAGLDPDWLRVGQDIVGGSPFPTFNAAFSLNGTAVPEPATVFGVLGGLALLGIGRAFSARRKATTVRVIS